MIDTGGPVSERLELQLNWWVLTALVFFTVVGFVVGAVASAAVLSGVQDAWPLATVGLLVGLVGLAAAVRYRLILTPEGFRTRFLWNNRLVQWTNVRGFEADIWPRGIWWQPRDPPPMPQSAWQWASVFAASGRWHIPLFGPSTEGLLATMNEWLNRYSAAKNEADLGETREIIVDDERLLQENPRLHSRLQQFQQGHMNLKDLDRLLKDLAPWSSQGKATPKDPGPL